MLFKQTRAQLLARLRTPAFSVLSLGMPVMFFALFNAIYGAQRGQLFPDEHVDVGATWKATMPIPSSSGFEGEVHYDYTYARKGAGVAVILCEGRFEGKRSVELVVTHDGSAH